MKASSGLSLVGLILSFIGIFIPFLGLFIAWIGLGFATIGAYMGDKGLAIATSLLCAVVFMFLSPTLWLEAATQNASYQSWSGQNGIATSGPILRIISIIMVVAPFAAMFIHKQSENAS